MVTSGRQNVVRIINPAAAVFVFRSLRSPSICAAEAAQPGQPAQKWFACTSSYVLGLRQCILCAAYLPQYPQIEALASSNYQARRFALFAPLVFVQPAKSLGKAISHSTINNFLHTKFGQTPSYHRAADGSTVITIA